MAPHMDNKPKPVVHPKIFNVNILNLVLGTLRNKKNAMRVSCGGGARGVPVAHGLLGLQNVIPMVWYKVMIH